MAEVIFSLIKSSLVFLSGILRSDSAKHISAIPSLLERPYSSIKASRRVLFDLFSLQKFTKRIAFSSISLESRNLEFCKIESAISTSDLNFEPVFTKISLLFLSYSKLSFKAPTSSIDASNMSPFLMFPTPAGVPVNKISPGLRITF